MVEAQPAATECGKEVSGEKPSSSIATPVPTGVMAHLRELHPAKLICSRQQLVKKLFTKEDPVFLHKYFGILCLVSFVYRYGIVYHRTGTLGFTGTTFDTVNMLAHLLLSSSSLIFKVLAKRSLVNRLVIWNEYRLHAIVFTCRCVSVYAWGVFRPARGTTLERMLLPMLVLAHHMVADEVTRRYGPKDKSQTTVRSDGDNGPIASLVLKVYSFYQFLALASHLLPHDRLADLGFNTLIAIQSSAFLMTLFRKGLIRNYSHGAWYTGCLLLSAYHVFCAYAGAGSLWFWTRALGAFTLRLNTRMSKYVIWSMFVFISIPAVEQVIFEALNAVYELAMAGAVMPDVSGVSTSAAVALAQGYGDQLASLGSDVSASLGQQFNTVADGVGSWGSSNLNIPSWKDATSSLADMDYVPSVDVTAWRLHVGNKWGTGVGSAMEYMPAGSSMLLGTLVALMVGIALNPGFSERALRHFRAFRAMLM